MIAHLSGTQDLNNAQAHSYHAEFRGGDAYTPALLRLQGSAHIRVKGAKHNTSLAGASHACVAFYTLKNGAYNALDLNVCRCVCVHACVCVRMQVCYLNTGEHLKSYKLAPIPSSATQKASVLSSKEHRAIQPTRVGTTAANVHL